MLTSTLQDLLPDIDEWLPHLLDNDVFIVPNPTRPPPPSSITSCTSPVKSAAGPAVAALRMATGCMVKLIFQGDIWVTDAKAKGGYTAITASNGHVKWDSSNDDLASLKAACYQVARSDVTGKPIESLLSISNSGSKVRGEWRCWIANSRTFPKTAHLRPKLSLENVQTWLKEAYGSNQEAGLSYRAFHPKKVHTEANVVSDVVVL